MSTEAVQLMAPSRAPSETTLVAAAIGLFFLLQLHLAFVFNINWDEFFFLSHVYSYQAGRLDSSFQTFHVHLFGWLTALPLSEPDQIVAARLVMIVAEAGTAWCIFHIAGMFGSKQHALFALFAYLASTYVLGHGASFRTDPIAAFLLMASLALLFATPAKWPAAALAGVLAGLGLLITVKGVFYFPAFLAALIFAAQSRAKFAATIRYFAVAGVSLALVYGAGMMAHIAQVSPAAGGTTGTAALQAQASSALTKTVLSQMLFPRIDYILRWLLASIVPAALLLFGLAIALSKLLAERFRPALVVLLLAAPLLSLVIYRNAFPYFFPFILAPAVPAIALASQRLDRPIWRNAALTGLFAGMAMQYAQLLPRDQLAQRQVIAAVHEIFPAPVNYIDRNGMLPSFPKTGFFMSSWGMELVSAAGSPALAPVIAQQRPPLVIANSPVLLKALDPSFVYSGPRLHPDDERALREHYVHYWGPIWLAGKDGKFDLGPGHRLPSPVKPFTNRPIYFGF